MRIFARYICLVFLIFALGCKDRFMPELKGSSDRLLVVEGTIALGAERTTISLSRTVPVNEAGSRVPESGAVVTIESDDNMVYRLSDVGSGQYVSSVLNLNGAKRYRLRIVSKGVQYVTDFLEAKLTPIVEDVNWTAKADGLHIFLNTRDNTNNSRYYKFSFEETWIFYANYNSSLIWSSGGLRARNRETQDIYKCWNTAASTTIVLGSSVKLSDDVINQQPITVVPSTSEKLTEKYSILVKQTVLTKEAFEFWENLRRNTESLGTIFDALPSQLTGNIRNVNNPNEPVLGFISVGEVKTKRIFVSKGELPNWRVERPVVCNVPDTLGLSQANIFSNPAYTPLEEIFSPALILIGYTGTTRECGDCTTRGTNVKPIFWQ